MSELKDIRDPSSFVKVFSSQLPVLGTIDLLAIRNAKEVTGQADLMSLSITDINPHEESSRKPSGLPPYTMDSFRGYRHKCLGVSQNSFSLNESSHILTIELITFPSALIQNYWSVQWINVVSIPGSGVMTIEVQSNSSLSARSTLVEVFSNGLLINISIQQSANPFGGI